MKNNKLLKLLLVSVVFGLGACSSSSSSSNNSNSLSNNVSNKEYKVTWIVDDSTYVESYKEGETPVYKFGTSKENDMTYTYTFSGWDKLIEPVTSDVTYTAQYVKEYIDYTYTWIINDEEVTETYHYGDEVSYKGETPTKEGNEQYSYVFTGWSKETSTVTGDEVNEAQFEKVLNSYKVTFDVNGEKITDTYYYGEIPKYDGTPSKEDTNDIHYEFKGWDKNIGPVTSDVTYTAIFEEKVFEYYNVNFYDFDGNLLYSQNLKEGSVPSFTGNLPTIEGDNDQMYEFTGWLNRDTNESYKEELPEVVGETNYYAYADEIGMLAINLFDINGELIETKNLIINNEESYEYLVPDRLGYVPNNDYVKGVMNLYSSYNIYYSELDVWDGSSVSSSFVGEGTEENPYLIQSAADLALLKSNASTGSLYNNKYFKMTKSIDLNNSNFIISNFSGNFDGNNCSIRGLAINSNSNCTGLFSSVSSGEIKNLSTYGEVYGLDRVGVIVGESYGTLINCQNYATVYGKSYRGGLAGVTHSKVINCINYGESLVRSGYDSWASGGLIGMANANVENSKNFGNVSGTTTDIGGLISIANNEVINCENHGNVSGGTWGAGGIVASAGDSFIVKKCINYGAISVSGGQSAGIIGKLKGEVAHCINYGNIIGSVLCGGIAGSDQDKVNINNCINKGVVKASSQSGGIIGRAKGEISNCINNGNVSVDVISKSYVGGIVGLNSGSTSAGGTQPLNISNCENTGNITGGEFSAGIIGLLYRGNVIDSKNSGTINGTNTIAGIVGATLWTKDGELEVYKNLISNCENRGTINNTSYFGAGIIGIAAYVDIYNCKNYGDVGSVGDNTGGIMGTIYAGSTAQNCINYGEIKGKNNIGGITAQLDGGKIIGCSNNGKCIATNSDGASGDIYGAYRSGEVIE